MIGLMELIFQEHRGGNRGQGRDQSSKLRFAGPVKHAFFVKVNGFAKSPSAAMRGGFLLAAARATTPTTAASRNLQKPGFGGSCHDVPRRKLRDRMSTVERPNQSIG
jgi:hypothetical protein